MIPPLEHGPQAAQTTQALIRSRSSDKRLAGHHADERRRWLGLLLVAAGIALMASGGWLAFAS